MWRAACGGQEAAAAFSTQASERAWHDEVRVGSTPGGALGWACSMTGSRPLGLHRVGPGDTGLLAAPAPGAFPGPSACHAGPDCRPPAGEPPSFRGAQRGPWAWRTALAEATDVPSREGPSFLQQPRGGDHGALAGAPSPGQMAVVSGDGHGPHGWRVPWSLGSRSLSPLVLCQKNHSCW